MALNNEVELRTITDFAVQWCKTFLGEDLDAEIVFNKRLLTKRINGRYLPHSNTIELSPQLYELNPLAIQAVAKHEMCHWFMVKHNLPAHDNLAPFERLLKAHGLITNGNYPRAREIVLAHQVVKVISCRRCRTKFFEVGEVDKFKIPEGMTFECDCNDQYMNVDVGKEQVVHYHTYEYLLYNKDEDLYHLSGDFMLRKDYSLLGGNPKEGYLTNFIKF